MITVNSSRSTHQIAPKRKELFSVIAQRRARLLNTRKKEKSFHLRGNLSAKENGEKMENFLICARDKLHGMNIAFMNIAIKL
jgi:hypothetical protein